MARTLTADIYAFHLPKVRKNPFGKNQSDFNERRTEYYVFIWYNVNLIQIDVNLI